MSIFNSSTKVPKRGWRCPDPALLAAYLDGRVNENQRQALEGHLADCGYCLRSVAGAISDLGQPATSTPAWLREKAEAQARPAKPGTRRWVWALAPALAAALLIAVLAKLPTAPRKTVPAAIQSAPGASVTSRPDLPAPAAPSVSTRGAERFSAPLRLLAPPAGAVLEPNRLRFEWSAVANAASYRVRITTIDGNLQWEERVQRPNAMTPATLKLASGSYFVWVTAYLDDGRELQSAPVQFQVRGRT